jgi:hypothetical protein
MPKFEVISSIRETMVYKPVRNDEVLKPFETDDWNKAEAHWEWRIKNTSRGIGFEVVEHIMRVHMVGVWVVIRREMVNWEELVVVRC